jgi:hypothetical protein
MDLGYGIESALNAEIMAIAYTKRIDVSFVALLLYMQCS